MTKNDLKYTMAVVNSLGFNIYAFMGAFRKAMRKQKSLLFKPEYDIPAEILMPILDDYIEQRSKIDKPFPWFKRVLQSEIEKWWVSHQITESEELNRQPVLRRNEILTVKDILEKMNFQAEVPQCDL